MVEEKSIQFRDIRKDLNLSMKVTMLIRHQSNMP